MIQKRYKQTEALAQAQGLKAIIEAQEVILAQIELPELVDMPNHNQVLRVKDVNVATSSDFIQITPKRILIHKTTGKEIDLNLFVPDWTIRKSNQSSHVGEDGQRIMYEMEWYDDETDEVVTEHTYDKEIINEDGSIIYEEVTEQLDPLPNEAFMMPTIPYIMFFTKNVVLPDLIKNFSHQFIADNMDVWYNIERE